MSDRIEVRYDSDDATVSAALKENKAYIAEQVLAVVFDEQKGLTGDTEEVGDAKVVFVLKKA